MGALRLLLSRWRVDLPLLGLLVVVVASTAALVGAVPRLLDQLERASLEEELDRITVDRRGLAASLIRDTSFVDVDRGWGTLLGLGELLEEDVDDPLAEVLAEPVPVVDSLRWSLGGPPGEPPPDALIRLLTVRTQLDLPDLPLVEGRLPDGRVDRITVETGAVDADGEPVVAELPVHEVLMTAESAAAMLMEVGDRRTMEVDAEGPNARRVVPRPQGTAVVELAGIVELTPVDDPVWWGDARLHRPARFDTNQNSTLFAFALVPPALAGELPGATDRSPAGVSWRWRLDEEALLTADPGPVADAALTLRTTLAVDVDEPRWSTGLDRLIRREQARRATAVEVLGLAVVAVVGVAAALLGAVGVVLATRRRDALALVRGRGTSRVQSFAAAVVEATLVCTAGVAVALGTLAVVLPGRGGEALVAGVGLLAAAVLVATTWSDVTRPLGALLAERRRGTGRRHAGRPVLEGLVVLLAVVSVLAVRQRGVGVDGVVDPLVVAAPAAVALATAVLAARLVPLVLRVLGPLAVRRRRGLPGPLGVARATRQRRGGPVVLLVTLGIGVAATAIAVQATLVAGTQQAAAEQVGADVRIEAPPLATLDPTWTPPDEDAEVLEVGVVDGVVVGSTRGQTVDVVLVDAGGFAAVTEAAGLPSLVWDGVAPAPMLVAGPLTSLDEPPVGTSLSLSVGGDRAAVTLAGYVPRVLGFDATEDGRFVVLEAEAIALATGATPEPSARLVRTDEPDAVAASARRADPGAEVLVRRDVEEAIAAVPLALGVRIGFTVAAVAVVAATLLAVVLALAAAAPVRRREAAVLAAVGTSRSRIAWTALAEVLPVVAASAALGLALAATVTVVLGERLDLAAFTGTADPVWLRLPPLVPAGTVTGLVLAVAAVAAVVTIGRVDTAALLREGE